MKKIFLFCAWFCGWLILTQQPVIDPDLPWLHKTPEEIEAILDALAQQPPDFV